MVLCAAAPGSSAWLLWEPYLSPVLSCPLLPFLVALLSGAGHRQAPADASSEVPVPTCKVLQLGFLWGRSILCLFPPVPSVPPFCLPRRAGIPLAACLLAGCWWAVSRAEALAISWQVWGQQAPETSPLGLSHHIGQGLEGTAESLAAPES